MNTYITNTELQSVVSEKMRGHRRERVKLTQGDGHRLRGMALHVLSLIF